MTWVISWATTPKYKTKSNPLLDQKVRWLKSVVKIRVFPSATVHILGACKVLMQQGSYIFRPNIVLHKIIESLKSFIQNIKQAVSISPK